MGWDKVSIFLAAARAEPFVAAAKRRRSTARRSFEGGAPRQATPKTYRFTAMGLLRLPGSIQRRTRRL
jgi:hypothetical protein